MYSALFRELYATKESLLLQQQQQQLLLQQRQQNEQVSDVKDSGDNEDEPDGCFNHRKEHCPVRSQLVTRDELLQHAKYIIETTSDHQRFKENFHSIIPQLFLNAHAVLLKSSESFLSPTFSSTTCSTSTLSSFNHVESESARVHSNILEVDLDGSNSFSAVEESMMAAAAGSGTEEASLAAVAAAGDVTGRVGSAQAQTSNNVNPDTEHHPLFTPSAVAAVDAGVNRYKIVDQSASSSATLVSSWLNVLKDYHYALGTSVGGGGPGGSGLNPNYLQQLQQLLASQSVQHQHLLSQHKLPPQLYPWIDGIGGNSGNLTPLEQPLSVPRINVTDGLSGGSDDDVDLQLVERHESVQPRRQRKAVYETSTSLKVQHRVLSPIKSADASFADQRDFFDEMTSETACCEPCAQHVTVASSECFDRNCAGDYNVEEEDDVCGRRPEDSTSSHCSSTTSIDDIKRHLNRVSSRQSPPAAAPPSPAPEDMEEFDESDNCPRFDVMMSSMTSLSDRKRSALSSRKGTIPFANRTLSGEGSVPTAAAVTSAAYPDYHLSLTETNSLLESRLMARRASTPCVNGMLFENGLSSQIPSTSAAGHRQYNQTTHGCFQRGHHQPPLDFESLKEKLEKLMTPGPVEVDRKVSAALKDSKAAAVSVSSYSTHHLPSNVQHANVVSSSPPAASSNIVATDATTSSSHVLRDSAVVPRSSHETTTVPSPEAVNLARLLQSRQPVTSSLSSGSACKEGLGTVLPEGGDSTKIQSSSTENDIIDVIDHVMRTSPVARMLVNYVTEQSVLLDSGLKILLQRHRDELTQLESRQKVEIEELQRMFATSTTNPPSGHLPNDGLSTSSSDVTAAPVEPRVNQSEFVADNLSKLSSELRMQPQQLQNLQLYPQANTTRVELPPSSQQQTTATVDSYSSYAAIDYGNRPTVYENYMPVYSYPYSYPCTYQQQQQQQQLMMPWLTNVMGALPTTQLSSWPIGLPQISSAAPYVYAGQMPATTSLMTTVDPNFQGMTTTTARPASTTSGFTSSLGGGGGQSTSDVPQRQLPTTTCSIHNGAEPSVVDARSVLLKQLKLQQLQQPSNEPAPAAPSDMSSLLACGDNEHLVNVRRFSLGSYEIQQSLQKFHSAAARQIGNRRPTFTVPSGSDLRTVYTPRADNFDSVQTISACANFRRESEPDGTWLNAVRQRQQQQQPQPQLQQQQYALAEGYYANQLQQSADCQYSQPQLQSFPRLALPVVHPVSSAAAQNAMPASYSSFVNEQYATTQQQYLRVLQQNQMQQQLLLQQLQLGSQPMALSTAHLLPQQQPLLQQQQHIFRV